MLEALLYGLALPLALIGFASVAMMFYTSTKAMSSATIEENQLWKRRYYKWMVSFILVWAFMALLLKFGGKGR